MARVGTCLVVGLLAAAAAMAESAVPPEQTFESLYAEKLQKVQATRDREDDVALAAELVAAAADARPELARLLCTKAYDLAANPLGWDKAAEAKCLLAEKAPQEAGQHLDDAVSAYWQALKKVRGPARTEVGNALVETALEAAEALARQGDAKAVAMIRQAERAARTAAPQRVAEVRDRQGAISQRVRLEKEVGGLVKRLEADPDNTAVATKLVRTFVTELDEPARALPHLETCDDAEMKKYVPGAAKPVHEAPDLACRELGAWYAGLAEKASSVAKEPMLVRAWRYLERYLRIHEAEDLARAEAAKVMEQLEEGLKKLGPPKGLAVGPGRWISLLPYVNLKEDTLHEAWKPHGPALVASEGGKLRLPCRPRGSYELSARVVTLDPGRLIQIAFMLPVGASNGTYWLAREGVFGAIREGYGAKAPPGKVAVGKPYLVDIRVLSEGDKGEIRVRVNGKPHLSWKGDPAKLRWGWAMDMPTKDYLGLGAATHAGNATVLFADVRLRMISGRAYLLR